jgi:2-keto-4-pentenoate hydratase/2-oxohepta-3-ene-1,7-dioic acid hydratase in catechol pathway
MRFATFSLDGRVRAGVVSGAGLHPLADGMSVLQLVRAGLPDALDAGQHALDGPAVPLEAVRLLPPLDPPTIRDFVAFEEHVAGVVASVGDGAGVVPEWYEAPTFYFTNPYAVTGPYDDVPVPPGSELLDFELEVAAVVGRDGRRSRRSKPGTMSSGTRS